WGEWGQCDSTAHRTRKRAIVSPACNGGVVAGPTSETESCQEICQPTYNPWPTDSAGQEVWGPCDQSTGIQARTRAIVNPPTAGQQPCATTETRTCAVNCVLDAWGTWSKCDECTGLQNHTRNVLQPMRNGGNKCGPTQESQNCAVECMTGPWSPWSPPDETCTCHSTRQQFAPPVNGGACVLTQTNPTCVQNCAVSEWGLPGECQRSGPRAGFRQFNRSITTPVCNGGASCPDLTKWEPCDIDCVMGDWGVWTSCDLVQQIKTAARPVLQPSYNRGATCNATTKTAPCGDCADLVTPFTLSPCDKTTGLRVGTATYRFQPKQGQSCTLSTTETCPVDCDASNWSPGPCNVRGALAGQQKYTRAIVTAPLNGGAACPNMTKLEKCSVDCKPTDQWTPWSDCNVVTGLSTRKLEIDYPAQNGGSNAACMVSQTQACAVDCVIDADTGDVTRPALNGGKTCADVALAQNLPGDYSTTSKASNFAAMVGDHKEIVMSAIAAGGVGLAFVAVGVAQRRRHQRGYSTVRQ
ncbi:hypothetical protein As57867_016271, partial [Aphanomyces stellatus]